MPLLHLEAEQGVDGALCTPARLCAIEGGRGAACQLAQDCRGTFNERSVTQAALGSNSRPHTRARGDVGRLCWDKAACGAASAMADFGLCQQ